MHCPKCKAYTATEMLFDVEVDVCPTCQGIWFDRNELSRIVGSQQDLQLTGARMNETKYQCPRCHHALLEVPYTWDKTLMVDLCSSCEGIFLDHGELEKASAAVQAFQAKFPQHRLDQLRKRNDRREALSAVYHTAEPAAKAMDADRVTFLKRVYGLLTGTIGVTILGVGFGIAIQAWQYWIVWLIASFVLLLVALGCRRVRGLNLVVLFLFTFVEGLFLCGIIAHYFTQGDANLVWMALAMTLGIFGSLTGYIFVTKKDLSGWGGFLFGALLILVIAGLVLIFTSTPMAELIWSVLGALLFCGFILYDTSRIILKYSTEEYVAATIDLYLDFINLFLDILRILAASRR